MPRGYMEIGFMSLLHGLAARSMQAWVRALLRGSVQFEHRLWSLDPGASGATPNSVLCDSQDLSSAPHGAPCEWWVESRLGMGGYSLTARLLEKSSVPAGRNLLT